MRRQVLFLFCFLCPSIIQMFSVFFFIIHPVKKKQKQLIRKKKLMSCEIQVLKKKKKERKVKEGLEQKTNTGDVFFLPPGRQNVLKCSACIIRGTLQKTNKSFLLNLLHSQHDIQD